MKLTKHTINSPEAIDERPATRKAFLEPEISDPIDVLEATAFFVGGSATTDVDNPSLDTP
jgi:hypothetical protein